MRKLNESPHWILRELKFGVETLFVIVKCFILVLSKLANQLFKKSPLLKI